MTPNQPSLERLKDEASRSLLRLHANALEIESLLAARVGDPSGIEWLAEYAAINESSGYEILSKLRRLSK